MERVGSVLHGAYGDYYEQLLCLRALKRRHPNLRLVLFFADDVRRAEMGVFDLSFADEVHPATDLARVRVDRFHQFQIQEPELRRMLSVLPAPVRARFDFRCNLKPWASLRTLARPEAALELSEEGQRRLPEVMAANGLAPGVFQGFTVGFLWRYRTPGGFVSARGLPAEDVVRAEKSALLGTLIQQHGAQVLICGMNVPLTEENRRRIDRKFSPTGLDLPTAGATYLRGLSWGLEMEILSRCSLCLVMPSGFSEALWMKRDGPTQMIDAPPQYLAKLLWNRMPLFAVQDPRELAFQLRPHTAERVLRRLAPHLPGRVPIATGGQPSKPAAPSRGR